MQKRRALNFVLRVAVCALSSRKRSWQKLTDSGHAAVLQRWDWPPWQDKGAAGFMHASGGSWVCACVWTCSSDLDDLAMRVQLCQQHPPSTCVAWTAR